MNKLISSSCPIPIIQYYINNLKYIYIYEHDLHKMHCGLHIFLLIYFTIYNYLLFFESDHIWFQHHFIHMCVHPCFFSFFWKIRKPKIPFWIGHVDVWAVYFYEIFGCVYFILRIFLWAASKLLSGFLSVMFRTN